MQQLILGAGTAIWWQNDSHQNENIQNDYLQNDSSHQKESNKWQSAEWHSVELLSAECHSIERHSEVMHIKCSNQINCKWTPPLYTVKCQCSECRGAVSVSDTIY